MIKLLISYKSERVGETFVRNKESELEVIKINSEEKVNQVGKKENNK